jgi:hypothetical protein
MTALLAIATTTSTIEIFGAITRDRRALRACFSSRNGARTKRRAHRKRSRVARDRTRTRNTAAFVAREHVNGIRHAGRSARAEMWNADWLDASLSELPTQSEQRTHD